MFDYIEGKIEEANINSIIISNSGIGYKVFTPKPYIFKEGEIDKVYLYNYIREDEYSLYGFKDKETRDLFLKLINVKGLGPKVAINILGSGTTTGIIDAIERENILYLQKFPKVGEKLARQIILDLRGKLVGTKEEETVNEELVASLLSLGYKSADIKRVTKEVDTKLSIEEQIKEALKLLLK